MPNIQPDDLILVAIVKHPRDLEIARLLGWYRIPLASSPKTVRVDWLAFYQPASFGEERWSVRYAARVKGHEMVKRIDLLHDEPEHTRAQEPYYKIQLGQIFTLEREIHSRAWRRFVFLYTTGQRLLAADDIRDLAVPPSDERDLLWRLLRERGVEHYNSAGVHG
ncbi:MAG: hypothetical protein IIC78_07720 [Chloroflexi bacterium]|nr:hypothetical protein [Chloroflexota bacterium]